MSAPTLESKVRLPRTRFVMPGVRSFTGADGRTYVVAKAFGAYQVHGEKALTRGPQPSNWISSHATLRDALMSV